jgi:CRP-like cAMP-binding protein
MDTPYTSLHSFVNSIFPLSASSFRELTALFSYVSIPKDEVFIRKDKTNTLEYIILEGVCKSFVYNPEGEEITLGFYQGKSILPPHITRTINDRSILNFQAITPLEAAFFNAHEFVKLMINNLDIRNFGNTVLKNELLHKVDKEIGLASLTAKERLLTFRKTYHMLENLVPHPQIASYLGITSISLSRIRGELARE